MRFLLAALCAPVAAAPTVVPLTNFTVPPGFEVTLWAQAPQLRNPTNMDIDAQGRIWVTEGANYRRHEGRDPAGDRVMVLEDTDQDGRADRSHVFVQEPNLVAPLGIAVIDNQIVVSNAPDLIVYTDVDRDLKFDPRVDWREVLLTGFAGRNHDHSLHSVTFGPDGLWYFNHGNTGALVADRSGKMFRVGSLEKSEPYYGWTADQLSGARSDDGHVYVGGFAARMRPDGTKLEVIGHNFRNSYEQSITSFGDVFHNDNDEPPACRTTFLIEYGSVGYFSADGTRRWAADRRPGQNIATAEWRQEDPGVIPAGDVYGAGAPTGIVTNEGDALGAKWRGLLLSAEAGRNTIFGYLPRPEGAGYTLERFDFLTSNREQRFAGTDFQRTTAPSEIQTWFRPSDVAIGADGAIYVADWFDPRVGGHEDLDDTTSGAIYRIAPKGKRLVSPAIDAHTFEGQLAALRSSAVNVRALGFNGLKARGAESVAPVAALLTDANPYVRARAVWLLAQLGAPGVAHVERMLDPKDVQGADPMMRVTAYRALRRVDGDLLGRARRVAQDPSASVRREVAVSMRDVPFADSRDVLLALARSYDGKDRSYLAAWGIGATGKEAPLYAALASTATTGPMAWSAPYADLVWRLTPAAAVDAFAARASATALPPAQRKAALTALGFIPTRDAAFALLDLAGNFDGTRQDNIALWWLLQYKDTRWAGHGLDAELKRRGLYDAEAIELTEVRLPVPGPKDATPTLAEVLPLKGDAKRGAVVAQACLMCHRIGDRGVEYAPSLTGFASRQTREVVIAAVVDPSSDIAHGYDGIRIRTKEGLTIEGIELTRGDPTFMQSTGGVVQMIPGARIAERKGTGRSLMLSASELGLTAQQVADVVAYLQTVK